MASLTESAVLEGLQEEYLHHTEQLKLLLVRKAKSIRALEEQDLFCLPEQQQNKIIRTKNMLQNELQTLAHLLNYVQQLYWHYLAADIEKTQLQQQQQLAVYYQYQYAHERALHTGAIESMELLNDKLTSLLTNL